MAEHAERQEAPEAAKWPKALDAAALALPHDLSELSRGEAALLALEAAMNPALGDQRLVPYGQARAEVLGEAVEVLRTHGPVGHRPDIPCTYGEFFAEVLNRHFDLPTQSAREDGEPDGR